MAEDEFLDGLEEEEEEEQEEEQTEFEDEEEESAGEMKPSPLRKKPCKTKRIDELAAPNKRIVLSTWQLYSHHFEPERQEATKKLLRELYSMNAKEAEEYFLKKRKELKEQEKKRKQKQKLTKLYKRKRENELREKAIKKYECIFEQGIRFARFNDVTPLVTIRTRNIADVLLQQLKGTRNEPDEELQYLIRICDWAAILIAKIYFDVQRNKEADLAEIEENAVTQEAVQGGKQGKVIGPEAVISEEVKIEEPELAEEQEGGEVEEGEVEGGDVEEAEVEGEEIEELPVVDIKLDDIKEEIKTERADEPEEEIMDQIMDQIKTDLKEEPESDEELEME